MQVAQFIKLDNFITNINFKNYFYYLLSMENESDHKLIADGDNIPNLTLTNNATTASQSASSGQSKKKACPSPAEKSAWDALLQELVEAIKSKPAPPHSPSPPPGEEDDQDQADPSFDHHYRVHSPYFIGAQPYLMFAPPYFMQPYPALPQPLNLSSTSPDKQVDELSASLDRLDKDNQDLADPLCAPINEKLAETCTRWFRNQRTKSDIMELLQQCEWPSNCDGLKVVAINNEVKKAMNRKNHDKDKKMKYIANGICKAAQPLVGVWNQLVQYEHAVKQDAVEHGELEESAPFVQVGTKVFDFTQIIQEVELGLKTLGVCNMQATKKWCLDLQYLLVPSAKELAHEKQPITDNMFGENMQDSHKDLISANKVTKVMVPQPTRETTPSPPLQSFFRIYGLRCPPQCKPAVVPKTTPKPVVRTTSSKLPITTPVFQQLQVPRFQLLWPWLQQQQPPRQEKLVSIPLPHIPVGGRTKYFLNQWYKLTKDLFIIQCVKGCQIDIVGDSTRCKHKAELKMSTEELEAGDKQIAQLLAKNVIMPAVSSPNQCISNMFLRPKQDKGWRLILNLSNFNWVVSKKKFKMETLDHIIAAMTEKCYMCVLDLSDAYLTLWVNKQFWLVLRFYWQGRLLQYIVLPFGLSSSPWLFSKVMKVVVSHLCKMGYIVIYYLDDGWQCGRTYNKCLQACYATHNLLVACSFIPNLSKSSLVPSQQVSMLGFELNSVTMTIQISKEKEKNILELIHITLTADRTIWQLARLIGKLISIMRVLPQGKQHYRSLEHDKLHGLHTTGWKWYSFCTLSMHSQTDLLWWLHNIPGAVCSLWETNPDCLMRTDSSDYAWGGGTRQKINCTGKFHSGRESSEYQHKRNPGNLVLSTELQIINSKLPSKNRRWLRMCDCLHMWHGWHEIRTVQQNCCRCLGSSRQIKCEIVH